METRYPVVVHLLTRENCGEMVALKVWTDFGRGRGIGLRRCGSGGGWRKHGGPAFDK